MINIINLQKNIERANIKRIIEHPEFYYDARTSNNNKFMVKQNYALVVVEILWFPLAETLLVFATFETNINKNKKTLSVQILGLTKWIELDVLLVDI